MSEFNTTLAYQTAFPLAARAYTSSGFVEDCSRPLSRWCYGTGTFSHKVNSGGPRDLQGGLEAGPAARDMLGNVVADGVTLGLTAAFSGSVMIAFRNTTSILKPRKRKLVKLAQL